MVPLEILQWVLDLTFFVAFAIFLRHHFNLKEELYKYIEKRQTAYKNSELNCKHHYRFGGREITNGVYRTIIVCDECQVSQVIEEV